MEAAAAAVLTLALACAGARAVAGDNDTLRLDKCCALGEQLDAAWEGCVARAGGQLSTMAYEELRPPLSAEDAYWVPVWLRDRPLHAGYSRLDSLGADFTLSATLQADEATVARFLRVDNAARRFELEAFNLHESFVARQAFCLDATADPARPFAVVTKVSVAYVHKCCPKGQRLGTSEPCEAEPGTPPGPAPDKELLVPPDDAAAMLWLPRRLRANGAVVARYAARPWALWNLAVDTEDSLRWRLVSGSGPELTVWLRSTDGALQGVTREACFDAAVLPGQEAPRVLLLASIAAVAKCCGRGEQLDARAHACQARPGDAPESTMVGTGDANVTSYWLPAVAAPSGRFPVRYMPDYHWGNTLKLPAEGADTGTWRVVRWRTDREPELELRMRTVAGGERVLRRRDFCFEAVAGAGPLTPRALVAFETGESGVTALPKCCPPGEALRGRDGAGEARCAPHTAADWAPARSAVAPLLPPDAVYVAEAHSNPLCTDAPLRLHAIASPQALLHRLRLNQVESRVSRSFFCADLLRAGEGASSREVLASCTLPPSAPLYEAVRPLHVVAAALLAAAVAALLLRPRTRSSTHGRALALHAACLLAANTLQAAWFFTQERWGSCDIFAYAIYFLLMAGAFWLSAIAFNMMRGFRRPQGARAAEAGGGGRRRFWIMSAYAWGGAAALTALCVAMHRWGAGARARGWVVPNLLETRTCHLDVLHSTVMYQPHILLDNPPTEDHLGALLYYYVPTGLLVLVNGVCLALTLLSIRRLSADAQRLRKESSALRTALLYVKLLLTAGALELAVEAGAWAARRRRFDRYWFWTKEVAQDSAYHFAVAATLVDVLRAAAVLWLCTGCGCCSCCGAAGRWLRARLPLRLRLPLRARVGPLQAPDSARAVSSPPCTETTAL